MNSDDERDPVCGEDFCQECGCCMACHDCTPEKCACFPSTHDDE